MRKLITLVLSILLLPMVAFAADQTWKNAPIVDVACATVAKHNPDAHTRECALNCQKDGFGIFTPASKFLKLDDQGNKLAIKALENTQQKDHIRVTVTGTQEGNTIRVTSLTLP
jgi:hypothetical protein